MLEKVMIFSSALNVSILQNPVADLFLDLLVTHPDNLVGLDVRELQVDLVSYDFLFLVRVDDAVDCPCKMKSAPSSFPHFLVVSGDA